MPRLVWSVLAALVLLCGCSGTQTPAARKSPRPKAEPVRPHAPVVFMLGDSYTAGIPSVPPEETYAAETARRLGWQVVIAGYAGTGFVARGRVGKDFAALFHAQLAWRPAPDMVVVSGGHNDRYPPARVRGAADRLLRDIRTRWPRSQVVLMGPLWGGDPPQRALLIRDVLRDAARTHQVPFVDPLAGRWITGHIRRDTGNARRYILRDGTHPNAAGNRYLADRLVTELRALGLDRPVLGRTHVRGRHGQPAQPGQRTPRASQRRPDGMPRP
ncbi:MAG TPA: SGNH/GDSL hydrolase family protein [Thermomonospora sp.]|nr:SGNH/GDSL hydrolase family protein [Thermomonospora sp.]